MIIGVLTNIGVQRIRKHISDYSAHYFYIAVGMCKTADLARVSDTALVKELDRAKASVAVSGDELTISISGTVDWSGEIMEVGIFTAEKDGLMIYRGLFSEDSTTAKSRYLKVGDTIAVSIVLDFATGAFV